MGKPPLAAAVRKRGDVASRIIRSLIVHRADATAQLDDMRWTALHHAARVGNVEGASVLLEFRADVNAKAMGKLTPIDVAKTDEVLRLLRANEKASISQRKGDEL